MRRNQAGRSWRNTTGSRNSDLRTYVWSDQNPRPSVSVHLRRDICPTAPSRLYSARRIGFERCGIHRCKRRFEVRIRLVAQSPEFSAGAWRLNQLYNRRFDQRCEESAAGRRRIALWRKQNAAPSKTQTRRGECESPNGRANQPAP